jgi:hypothetical protein
MFLEKRTIYRLTLSSLSVDQVQPRESDGVVPALPRLIHAEDPTFVISMDRACQTPQEVAESNPFSRLVRDVYERLFTDDKRMERRGIKVEQKIGDNEAFLRISKSITNLPDEAEAGTILQVLQLDNNGFEAFMRQAEGVVRFWLGLRSRLQLTQRGLKASEQQAHLDNAIRQFVEKINKIARQIGSQFSLEEVDFSYAPVSTVIGKNRHSQDTVFRINERMDSLAYPAGLDIATSRERRLAGDQIELAHVSEDEGERALLKEGTWVERSFLIGGIPATIYFNDAYGAHHLNGAENLFSPIPAEFAKLLPPVKIYFGVPDSIMRGRKRVIYSHEGELRMMIGAVTGANGTEPGQENYYDSDYFGITKKSTLTLINMWISLLSIATSTQFFSERDKKEKTDELMKGIPGELSPLVESLCNMLKNSPQAFEKLLPQIEIPEIDYYPGRPGFNPSRYVFSPIHGAAYTIRIHGKLVNLVLPGDSGVGKSEILRELMTMGIEVESIQADDMLLSVFDRQTGKTFSIGDEVGTFTKTDDIKGTVSTSEERPIIGYGATLPKKNRRVIESGVADPHIPKEVHSFVGLVNAFAHDGGERSQQVDLGAFVETWKEGPYRPSSSVQGGGVGSGMVNVFLWNEFGPQFLKGALRQLLDQQFVDDPESWGATPEEAGVIRETRESLKAIRINTHHNGSQDDLGDTFANAAGSMNMILHRVF